MCVREGEREREMERERVAEGYGKRSDCEIRYCGSSI